MLGHFKPIFHQKVHKLDEIDMPDAGWLGLALGWIGLPLGLFGLVLGAQGYLDTNMLVLAMQDKNIYAKLRPQLLQRQY